MTTYKQAVAEARQLVKRSEEDQWRLAELTWEQAEAGKPRRQWAEDVGVARKTVDRWFMAWAKFGSADPRPAWSDVYADLVPSAVGSERIERGVHNLPPERKAEVARELLTDPQVARAPQVREQVEHQVASDPAATVRVNQRAAQLRPEPAKPSTDPNEAGIAAAIGLGNQAVYAVRRLANDVSTLVSAMRSEAFRRNPVHADAIREDIADLRRASDMARSYADELEVALEGGVSDERLADLLRDEQ